VIETEIRDMLGRSLGDEPDFDPERYVTAACQARSHRRHRAAAGTVVLGTVVLGAAVLASAVVAWPAGHRARDHAVATDTSAPSPTLSPAAPPSPPPLTDAGAARLSAVIAQHFPMPAATHAVQSVTDPVHPLAVRLKRDTTTTTAGPPYYGGQFDLTGPDGTGGLDIRIIAAGLEDRNPTCEPYLPVCSRRTDPDGSLVTVTVTQGPPDNDMITWGVTVVRVDGTLVSFGLYNWGRFEDPSLKGSVTRAGRTGPPVPVEALVTLAERPDLHL
jgi:hypothetical protein